MVWQVAGGMLGACPVCPCCRQACTASTRRHFWCRSGQQGRRRAPRGCHHRWRQRGKRPARHTGPRAGTCRRRLAAAATAAGCRHHLRCHPGTANSIGSASCRPDLPGRCPRSTDYHHNWRQRDRLRSRHTGPSMGTSPRLLVVVGRLQECSPHLLRHLTGCTASTTPTACCRSSQWGRSCPARPRLGRSLHSCRTGRHTVPTREGRLQRLRRLVALRQGPVCTCQRRLLLLL